MKRGSKFGLWLAIGAGIGAAVGAETSQLGEGLAL